MKISAIKINGVREPVGFAMEGVTVSWKVLESESRRPREASVEVLTGDGRVLARRCGEKLNWTGEHLDLSLQPRQRYLVRIRVEGEAGDSAEAGSFFETGKMDEPWIADWIAAPRGDDCHPILRRKLTVRPGLQRARLYASGLGLFEAYVNGERLGEEYLKPGITGYEKRIQTITFPVDSLKEGENELRFLLGKGWYMGQFGLENTSVAVTAPCATVSFGQVMVTLPVPPEKVKPSGAYSPSGSPDASPIAPVPHSARQSASASNRRNVCFIFCPHPFFLITILYRMWRE